MIGWWGVDLEPEILTEYERVLKDLGDEEASSPGNLSSLDVLKAHFLIANQFYLEGEGLGGIGPKNMPLLQSAVFRQSTEYGGQRKWTTPYERCATLFYGLIKNHPFHDANKRTAFLCALLHLERCRLCPSVPEEQFEDFTVEVADNALGKYSRYKQYQNDGLGDPEVRFIAWYLRNNTRQIDKKAYTVTYRELRKILNGFGYGLSDPNNNYINIIKYVERREFFGFGKRYTDTIYLGQIGFPSWTREVGKEALKTVRRVTQLDFESGVDSAAFFKGVDPTQVLIASYQAPLRSLANR